MLDPAKYTVTNLGAPGATMQKGADSPYWLRPQYTTLTTNKWDIVVIMLGTNDAKDPGDHGPNNAHRPGPHQLLFAQDFFAMIKVVRASAPLRAFPPPSTWRPHRR